MTGADLLMEIGSKTWRADNGGDYAEFPLERLDDGRLTDVCRERLTMALRHFVSKKGWQPRRRALVAIGGRGVSLRRMAVPVAPKEELQRLLRLQIESEFPVPPDELAWGWQALGQNSGRQEVLVAAVKKEMVEPYAQILGACGIAPIFAIAALARAVLCPPPAPTCALLQIGATDSELLAFQDGTPSAIRLLAWGAESAAPFPAGLLNAQSFGGQLYVTGPGASGVAQILGSAPVLNTGAATERSAAIAGLKKAGAQLAIQVGESRNGVGRGEAWKWAVAAVILLAALVGLPYAEAVVLKPHLANKLAAIQAERGRLPAIDHELDFLQFIKRSQPPYLDTIYLISKLAPSGTTFESLAMTRRGELSLRGKLQNAQQVTEFRSNLVQSAWFSSVVFDEQSPSPDRQVTVRLTAMVKPVDARKPLTVETNAAGPPKE